MKTESGYIVETSSGKQGRTYHSKGIINDKVPVYLMDENGNVSKIAILCDPKSLKMMGYVD